MFLKRNKSNGKVLNELVRRRQDEKELFLKNNYLSNKSYKNVSLVDAFFITISAICVTGLSTIDVANSFNLFGYTIIALLIQIGGLGIVCAGLSIILLAGQKIGIKERILIKDSLGNPTILVYLLTSNTSSIYSLLSGWT